MTVRSSSCSMVRTCSATRDRLPEAGTQTRWSTSSCRRLRWSRSIMAEPSASPSSARPSRRSSSRSPRSSSTKFSLPPASACLSARGTSWARRWEVSRRSTWPCGGPTCSPAPCACRRRSGSIRRAIFGWVDQQPNPPESRRIYLDAGAKEAGGRLAGVVEAMGDRLRDRNLHVMVRIDPNGTHHESSWRKRLPRALRFVLA